MVKVPPQQKQSEDSHKVDPSQSPSTKPDLPRSDENLHPPNENPTPLDGDPSTSECSTLWKYGKYALPVVAGGAAVVGAPMVISAVGFKAGGIAAGSIAAKMMSAGAIANSGGVASGGVVATLQSVGAVGGLSAGASTALGTGAGAATAGTQVLGSYLTQQGTMGDADQSKGNEKPTNNAGTPSNTVHIQAENTEQSRTASARLMETAGVIVGAMGSLSTGASAALSTVTGVASAGTRALGSYLTQPGKTGAAEQSTGNEKPTNNADMPSNTVQVQAENTEQGRTAGARLMETADKSKGQQMGNSDPRGGSDTPTDGGVNYLVKNITQPFTGVIVGAMGSLSVGASAALSTVTGVASAGTRALGSYLTQPGKTGDAMTPTNGEKPTDNADMPNVQVQTKKYSNTAYDGSAKPKL